MLQSSQRNIEKEIQDAKKLIVEKTPVLEEVNEKLYQISINEIQELSDVDPEVKNKVIDSCICTIKHILDYDTVQSWGKALRFAVKVLEEKKEGETK